MYKNNFDESDRLFVSRLGLEVARFLSSHGIRSCSVRQRAHWGSTQFVQFKRGALSRISVSKFRSLLCALRVECVRQGHPEHFHAFLSRVEELLLQD